MLGTNFDGTLREIPNCYISVPGSQSRTITLNALPDISDSKSAAYNDEPVIGRSFPLKTFSHSENRAIQMTLHFYLVSSNDVIERLQDLRAIESAVYPRDGGGSTPFIPPPVCQIQCGRLLGEQPICVVLKSYSIRYGADVTWVESGGTYLPMKFDVDTQWDVIYKSDSLPGQDKIFSDGM